MNAPLEVDLCPDCHLPDNAPHSSSCPRAIAARPPPDLEDDPSARPVAAPLMRSTPAGKPLGKLVLETRHKLDQSLAIVRSVTRGGNVAGLSDVTAQLAEALLLLGHAEIQIERVRGLLSGGAL